MNVSLTPELEKFVEQEVRGGLYQTASEVVRAGLRQLKSEGEREKSGLRLARAPRTLEELQERLLQAARSLDAGEGLDGEAVMRDLIAQADKRKGSA